MVCVSDAPRHVLEAVIGWGGAEEEKSEQASTEIFEYIKQSVHARES